KLSELASGKPRANKFAHATRLDILDSQATGRSGDCWRDRRTLGHPDAAANSRRAGKYAAARRAQADDHAARAAQGAAGVLPGFFPRVVLSVVPVAADGDQSRVAESSRAVDPVLAGGGGGAVAHVRVHCDQVAALRVAVLSV